MHFSKVFLGPQKTNWGILSGNGYQYEWILLTNKLVDANANVVAVCAEFEENRPTV